MATSTFASKWLTFYFPGTEVPMFDIAKFYEGEDRKDMLVRNERLGTALAQSFLDKDDSRSKLPAHKVVLMKRHGFTTWGSQLEGAVYRAIYTKINASIQAQAMTLRRNFHGPNLGSTSEDGGETLAEALTEEMCRDCEKMNEGTMDKPWKLWVLEVEKSGLYTNNG
jgi:ribulose-5-phosphate 4-epimerase/fuculose-1-phosphate aldolase